jgi:hypothetical protein
LRKAIVAIVVLGALIGSSVASGSVVISLGYMHDQTARTAKRVANGTKDAENYGVVRCRRFSNLSGKCVGRISGHSVNPSDPAQTPLAWDCLFVERFRIDRFGQVHKGIGAVQCSGPGKAYIQRHK